MQAVPITTKVVSFNPTHGEVYSMQLLCDKVYQCSWFSPGTPVSSTDINYLHDTTEKSLKVALNTIVHNPHNQLNNDITIKQFSYKFSSTMLHDKVYSKSTS